MFVPQKLVKFVKNKFEKAYPSSNRGRLPRLGYDHSFCITKNSLLHPTHSVFNSRQLNSKFEAMKRVLVLPGYARQFILVAI